MIRLAVFASSPAVRAGLRALLASDPEFDVVLEAAGLDPAEEPAFEPEVLVILAEGLTRSDLEVMLAGQEEYPGLVLVGDQAQAAQMLAGLPLRAWGLLPLDATAEEFGAAVRAVYEGLVVGTPPLLGSLLASRLSISQEEESSLDPLTEREAEVLGLLAQGLANKQIAAELTISEHTAKFHVSSIYSKLGATNRAEAVRIGARLGLIVL